MDILALKNKALVSIENCNNPDELKLEDIHMGTSPGYGEIGKYDTVDQYGNINESGTTPNPDSSAYIDITKSTIAFITDMVIVLYSFASAALAETINPRRFTSTMYPSSSLMTK